MGCKSKFFLPRESITYIATCKLTFLFSEICPLTLQILQQVSTFSVDTQVYTVRVLPQRMVITCTGHKSLTSISSMS